ncbi:MAG: hypothetical protein V8S84_13315 [Lachnospiraceae bacterium]
MEICQEAIDRSIQAESFRGLLPLLIKGIANDYRELGEPKIAISILRKGIKSFEKEQIGRENTCPGKGLLLEHLETYLGDVEAYEEAILYAKKELR